MSATVFTAARRIPMSTAAPTVDRLRQIAILVSIVDSVAARQLLSHLPPATTRKVLEIAKRLGPISEEEKHEILSAFQQSAAIDSSRVYRDETGVANEQPRNQQPSFQNNTSEADGPHPVNADAQLVEPATSPWAKLERIDLRRFLITERPNVIAVVISQLPSKSAVAILQDLGTELSCEVLRCLSTLGEIDPLAKAAIEEHLTERMGRHQTQSGSENARCIEELLLEAPPELRRQWRLAMGREFSPNESTGREFIGREFTGREFTGREASNHEATNHEETHHEVAENSNSDGMDKHFPGPGLRAGETDINGQPASHQWTDYYQNASFNTSEKESVAEAIQDPKPMAPSPASRKQDEADDSHESVNTLAFERSVKQTYEDELDRSLMQLEFERLLDLPQPALANILSTAGSRNVLLALAGATPEFMKRLYRMLERRDRQALDNRIKQVGVLHMRDIDNAQQQIISLADEFRKENPDSSQAVKRAA